MGFDNIELQQKDERSSGIIEIMRERLKRVKAPFIVAGAVATMGMYDLVKQPSTANAAGNIQGTMQVASLFKSREQRFVERRDYLLDKLTKIREEVRAEDGGEFYKRMETIINEDLKKPIDEYTRRSLEIKKQQIIKHSYEKHISFYEYNVNDIVNKKEGSYIAIPKICAARGEIWCEPTLGFYVATIDPSIKKKSEINSVAVPKADENIGTMRIPVKYIYRGMGMQNIPKNKLVYENAMKHVYRFFDGEIPKEEIDAVATELIEKGKNDTTAIDIIIKSANLKNGSKEKMTASMESEKARYFPDVKTEKKFNGKNYTFKYDNLGGYVIVDFPLN